MPPLEVLTAATLKANHRFFLNAAKPRGSAHPTALRYMVEDIKGLRLADA
jgi:hypothetical protein